MQNQKNEMVVQFNGVEENIPFARAVVGAFFSQMDPTIEELADVKTAVSEAVTNAVVHAYSEHNGAVEVLCRIQPEMFEITVTDWGCGIEDIDRAMQPFFTTGRADERSGMGFSVMQAFMDDLAVESCLERGTVVRMMKKIKSKGTGDSVE